jgi:hypothetical protein
LKKEAKMKTMNKCLLALGLLGCLALIAVPAGASTYGFDNLTPFTSIEGNTYYGVTYTSANHDTFVTNTPGAGSISPYNVISNSPYLIGDVLTMTFTTPQNSFSFIGGDNGGDKDHFVVKAFDASNTLLGTVDTLVFGGNPIDPNNFMVDNYLVNLSFNNMKYVTVEAFSVNGGYGIAIDNVQVVPLPPSVLLLGSGLLGLAGWRRFRKG